MTDTMKKRERMAELATEARAELDKITDKTEPSLAAEIEARFDSIMAQHDRLAKDVEREERVARAERELLESRRPAGESKTVAAVQETRNTPEYKEVFTKYVRFGGESLDAEERVVLASGRGEEVRAQAAGTPSAGGYTVPEDFSYEIDKALAIWGPMWDANICRELVTSGGNPLPWPTVDDTAARGRIKDENDDINDDGSDDVVFGQKSLSAYVYDTGLVRIPMELLQDSAFDVEALMTELFAERLGRTANEILTVGGGTTTPEGVLTNSAEGAVTPADAITSDRLIDLVHSVDAAYRSSPRTRFMFNDQTLAAIRKLKDGQNNYLWQMGDIRSSEPSTILGHPYSVNQALPDVVAGTKPILFGDFSRFVVRKVRGFQVLTLRERYAEFFQVGMVGFKRFDSVLLNTAAIKHLKIGPAAS